MCGTSLYLCELIKFPNHTAAALASCTGTTMDFTKPSNVLAVWLYIATYIIATLTIVKAVIKYL